MTARRRGLGRGLDSLLQAEEPLRSLPVGRLVPNRLQPRGEIASEDLSELTESIRTQGVVQPVVVTPAEDDRYMIVAGERRWRAAQRAGLQEVPVVVREVEDDRELLELALVENLQRSDLSPVEEADAYQLLAERFGLSHEEIAARVGKGRTTVTNTLRLLRLPEPVLELLRRGELTAGQARPLLSLEKEPEQVKLARRAVAEDLSARELETLAKRGGRKQSRSRSVPAPDVHAAAAAEELTRKLQTRVEIRRRGERGHVRLYFHSEEELMRLYDLLAKGRR